MDFGLPIYFLRLEIGILSGANDFGEAIARVCFPGRPLSEKAQVKEALRVAAIPQTPIRQSNESL